MTLYGYFRSSAAYRVRIALALKGLAYENAFVHLLRDGGGQFRPEYREMNPQAQVPSLEVNGEVLTQSLPIIQYLEEMHPEPPLLPATPLERARVRAIALAIACEVHPLNNLRVLGYLSNEIGVDDDTRVAWYRHWIANGFAAVETMVKRLPGRGRFCNSDAPGLAEICLVPQIFNARRFDCDLSAYPTLVAIDAACAELPAFRDAAPENQPDAE
ncbi:MAG: maleylacetoacetate isomerase [Alphaproteobacteria bacterium]|nr:maleylacetoacetate isomerase [Alphaproteobacteria bacterium]